MSDHYPGADVDTLRSIETTLDMMLKEMPSERTLIAAAAVQGLIVRGALLSSSVDETAEEAVNIADGLLKRMREVRP